MTIQSRRNNAWVVAAILAATVSACAPIIQNHGYVPPDDELAQLTVGQDTRDSVAETIGAPLSQSLLDRDDAWYYIASRRQTLGLREPQILSRQIVAIRFTEAGTVENIERFGLEDGRIVTLSARVTDPSVSERGLLRQIFSNIGGPSPEDLL